MNPGKIHKKQFARLLKMMASTVTVRQPVVRSVPQNDMEKVLGRKGTEHDHGAVQDVTVIWRNGHGKLLDNEATPLNIAAIGKTSGLDAVIRCMLEDVLVNPADKQGRTIFDTAKDVVYNGTSFQVVTTDRTGMPLEGPYILWVALRKGE
jgi:hypothetical protein